MRQMLRKREFMFLFIQLVNSKNPAKTRSSKQCKPQIFEFWSLFFSVLICYTKGKEGKLMVTPTNQPTDWHWVTRPDLETVFETKMVSRPVWRPFWDQNVTLYGDWSRDPFWDQNGLETSIKTKMSHSADRPTDRVNIVQSAFPKVGK